MPRLVRTMKAGERVCIRVDEREIWVYIRKVAGKEATICFEAPLEVEIQRQDNTDD